MLENFIVNHRKLSLFLSIIILVGLVIFIGYSVNNTLSNTTDQDTEMGDDSGGETGLVLPYENPIYTISLNTSAIAGIPKDKNLAIDAPYGYRSAAAQSLYDLGVDPTDYKITFNYESPFKPYE